MDKAPGLESAVNKLKSAAKITTVGVAAMVTGVAGATAGLFAMTKGTAEAYDVVGKFAGRIGISTEALSAYHYVAELSGVTQQTLNMGFQRMTRRISEASTGTGVATKALSELGISIDSITGKSPDQQFEMIAGAMEGVANQSDKARLAMQFFDSEGVALIQTMQGGVAGLRDMKKEAEKFGLIISDAAANNAAEFNDSLSRMKGSIKGLKNAFSEKLLPVFTDLANQFANYIADNRGKLVDYFEKISIVAIKSAGQIAIGINTLIEGAMSFFDRIRDVYGGVQGYMDSISSDTDKVNKRLVEARDIGNELFPSEEKIIAAGSAYKTTGDAMADAAKMGGKAMEISLNRLQVQVPVVQQELEKIPDAIKPETFEDKVNSVIENLVSQVEAGTKKARESMGAIGGVSVGAGPDSASTKAALAEIQGLYKQHFTTRTTLVNNWYSATLEKIKGHKDAEAELDALYTAKKAEAYDQDVASAQAKLDKINELENVSYIQKENALRSWLKAETDMFEENEEIMQELREMYKEQRDEWELENWEAKIELDAERMEYSQQQLDAHYMEQRRAHRNEINYLKKLDKEYQKHLQKLREQEQKNKAEDNRKTMFATKELFDWLIVQNKDYRGTLVKQEKEYNELLFELGRHFGKKGFAVSKALRIADATIKGVEAAVAAWDAGMSIGGPYAPAIAAAYMAVSIGITAAKISKIASTHFAGAAHGGLDYVPDEQTYLLARGERVLSPNQNADLTTALNEGSMGGTTINVSNFNLNIHVADADALMSVSNNDWEEIVHEKIMPAFGTLAIEGYSV